MEPIIESPETHQTPEVIEVPKAELEELRKKAEVSSQNFERLKKLEQEKKELETKLPTEGTKTDFDPSSFKKEVEEVVNLRVSGHSSEEIEKIEAFAKGAGITRTQAANDPFVRAAIEKMRAESKSVENTPAPSAKIRVFNGKPVDEIFKSGSAEEKQAAFQARIKGGVKNNE